MATIYFEKMLNGNVHLALASDKTILCVFKGTESLFKLENDNQKFKIAPNSYPDTDSVVINFRDIDGAISIPAISNGNLRQTLLELSENFFFSVNGITGPIDYNSLTNLPGLQEVCNVNSVTNTNLSVNKLGVGQTRILGGIIDNIESGSTTGLTINSKGLKHNSFLTNFETFVDFSTPTQNNVLNVPNKSGTFATLDDIFWQKDSNGAIFPKIDVKQVYFTGKGNLSRNTAFGLNALVSNLNGSGLTAFGSGALLNNTTGGSNTAFGNDSLTNNISGNGNTAVGTTSLFQNTGSFNTAFGFSALFSNTNSLSNNAFGGFSLQKNTTGSFNNAFGLNSLSNNVSGINNCAFGHNSLSNNVASANCAFGNESLGFNTTGPENSAFGSSAGRGNTTGGSNTAIGYFSMASNTSGNSNTVIGSSALGAAITNSNNTAIGSSALQRALSDNNVAIGFRAGERLTTGASNIFIGDRAGGQFAGQIITGRSNYCIGARSGTALTTGFNNILLGLNAGGQLSTGNSNISIGNSSIFNNAASSGNITIGCEFQRIHNGNQNIAIATRLLAETVQPISNGNNNVFIGAIPLGSVQDTIIIGTGAGVERLRIDATGCVGIGTTAPSTSAILDLTSSTKTFLPPRMTSAQRNAIVGVQNGALIYNTNSNKFNFRENNNWVDFAIATTNKVFVKMTFPGQTLVNGGGTINGGYSVAQDDTGSWNNTTGTFTNNTGRTVKLQISGCLAFAPGSWNTSGDRLMTYLTGSVSDRIGWGNAPTNNFSQYVGTTLSGVIVLTAGQSFQFGTQQFSGSNKTIQAGLDSPISIIEI